LSGSQPSTTDSQPLLCDLCVLLWSEIGVSFSRGSRIWRFPCLHPPPSTLNCYELESRSPRPETDWPQRTQRPQRRIRSVLFAISAFSCGKECVSGFRVFGVFRSEFLRRRVHHQHRLRRPGHRHQRRHISEFAPRTSTFAPSAWLPPPHPRRRPHPFPLLLERPAPHFNPVPAGTGTGAASESQSRRASPTPASPCPWRQ